MVLHSVTPRCYFLACPDHDMEDHVVFDPDGEEEFSYYVDGAFRCGGRVFRFEGEGNCPSCGEVVPQTTD